VRRTSNTLTGYHFKIAGTHAPVCLISRQTTSHYGINVWEENTWRIQTSRCHGGSSHYLYGKLYFHTRPIPLNYLKYQIKCGDISFGEDLFKSLSLCQNSSECWAIYILTRSHRSSALFLSRNLPFALAVFLFLNPLLNAHPVGFEPEFLSYHIEVPTTTLKLRS